MGNNGNGKISVLVVDDHQIWRGGILRVIELQKDMEVIGEVDNGEDALAIIREKQPDVVLMDVSMPKMNGIEVTARLKSERKNKSAIIMLTAYVDAGHTLHAIRAGASAFCPKDIESEKLPDIIREVAGGGYAINDRVYDKRAIREWENAVLESITNPYMDHDDQFRPLSPREMEILRYVVFGKSNMEIAYTLGISHQTVKNHMTSILKKMDVQDRTQAAVYALTHGWVRIRDWVENQ